MNKPKTPAEQVQCAEQRIDWVLSHPHVSEWLKVSLHMAHKRDPIDMMNDLELLTRLLQDRSHALVDDLLLQTTNPSTDHTDRSD
ncbi:hypothetical protein PY254_03250 [Rhodanobacter sp. AS-Z3]|uniref:hypothetical protein n=1 Tax=Rhodanobacter sp. AS-Z3 TaxID=3031330 RepID=UPI0024794516|nr:hypothetical protein [Rhodanobacter sp. AS-Z3]WEN15705.1 hypothetical protein PY254_03250 [Rhodanobacter sp. AS-Z3]